MFHPPNVTDYELVRYHHPDSHHCRSLPEAKAHSQFQAIIAAYDYLQGKTSSHLPGAKRYGWSPETSNFDPYLHELARRRRAAEASRPHHQPYPSEEDNYDPNGRRERMILAVGVFVSSPRLGDRGFAP
mgnify:CR=1 FL=1